MRNLCLLFLVGLVALVLGEKQLVSSQSPFTTTDDLYLEGRTSGDLPIDDEDGEDGGSGSGSGDYDEYYNKFLNISNEVAPSQPQPTASSTYTPPTTVKDAEETTVKDTEETTVKDTEETTAIFTDGGSKDEEVETVGPTADWFSQSTVVDTTVEPPSETTPSKFSPDTSISKDDDEDNSLEKWSISTTTEDEVEVEVTEVENEIVARDGRRNSQLDVSSPEEVTSENLWERTEVLAAVIACGVVGFLCAVFLLALVTYRMKKKDEGSYDLGDTKLSSTAYHKAPTKEFYA
ncbi:uncharacterized protein V6R79_018473 [Siganus canaliculatus]